MFKRLASSSALLEIPRSPASVKPVLEHRDSPASVMDQNLSLSPEHDKLKEKLRQHFLDSLGEAGSEDFSEQVENCVRKLSLESIECIDFAFSKQQKRCYKKERQALVTLIEKQILPDQSNAEKVDLEFEVKKIFCKKQDELKEKLRQHFLNRLGEAGSEDFREQVEDCVRKLSLESMACIDFALSNKHNPDLEKERQALVALIEKQILPDQSNAEKVDLEFEVKKILCNKQDELVEKLMILFFSGCLDAKNYNVFSTQVEDCLRKLSLESMACIDVALSNKQNPGLEKEKPTLDALIVEQLLHKESESQENIFFTKKVKDYLNALDIDQFEKLNKAVEYCVKIEKIMSILGEDQFKQLNIALNNEKVEFLVGFVYQWIEFLYKENDIFINHKPQIDTYHKMKETNSLGFQFIHSIEKLYKKYNSSGLKEYKGSTIGRSSVRKKAATWSATQMGATQHTNFQSQESVAGFSGFPPQCDTKKKLSYCSDVKAESQNPSPSYGLFKHLIAFIRGE